MSRQFRILVLGGTHGNESLGIRLVKLLMKQPVPGVAACIANPRAVRARRRFVESDLNRSFGSDFPGTYESRRASQLKKLCKEYDVVLDLHNTQAPGNNCAFVGENCNPQLFEVCKRLGLDLCVEATYDCINMACSNVLSIEISQDDSLDNAQYWYEQIQKLAQPLNRYRFERRVTWNEARKLNVADWQPFQPLSQADKAALAVDGEIVPIFIGSTLTEYYATLIRKEKNE